jgi:hypothetical protein
VPRVAEHGQPAAELAGFTVEDGVVEEARRRQRRRRIAVSAAALVALVAALLGPLLYGTGGTLRPPSPLRPVSSLMPLSGPPLVGATHLTLAVSEDGGSVFLVDVDRHSARLVPGLGVSRKQGPQVTLTAYESGVLAAVTHSSCQMWVSCAKGQAAFPDSESEFLISRSGSVRPVVTFALTRHQDTTQAFHSTSTWVSTWPHTGPCTLALVPGSRPAIRIPCGALGPDTAHGLWIANGNVEMLVDPQTGRVLQRQRPAGVLIRLPGDFALESAAIPGATPLSLVNLATGARRSLGWPSSLRFSYQARPAPHGPLVALLFGDPFHPVAGESVNQAADAWVLNTTTGSLTHVPGFPALELLKQSSIAWSAADQLVIAARGGGRTVVGVWKPGQSTLPIRAVPGLAGYSQFVALSR